MTGERVGVGMGDGGREWDEGRENITKGNQLKTAMMRGAGGLVSLVALQPGVMTGSEGLGGLGSDGLFWKIIPQVDGRVKRAALVLDF